MIQMHKYSKKFKNYYAKKVFEVVPKDTRVKLVASIKKYFPRDFFISNDVDTIFRKLILSQYRDLRKIYIYIRMISKAEMERECFNPLTRKRTALYDQYYGLYSYLRDCCSENTKMNVKIVYESGMMTCPYCNRDYINSRGGKAAGAQLDHFFDRAAFPVFALCLYNLVPACGNCNRIKSDQKKRLISPFDESVVMDEELTFKYKPKEPEEYDQIQLYIDTKRKMENNVSVLKLRQAYEIHDEDVRELVIKRDMYIESQIEELEDVFQDAGVTVSAKEIKAMIFGTEIRPEEYGRRPLSKLRHDIMKELNIY